MRHQVLKSALLVLVLGGALGACADNQIGRTCNDPSVNAGTGTKNGFTIVNPAPDCPSRLCITTASASRPTLSACSATCVTDTDCETASEFTSDKNRCTKFVCVYPAVVPGDNFCCKKLCMCEADVPAYAKNPPSGRQLQKDLDGVPIPDYCRNADACQIPK